MLEVDAGDTIRDVDANRRSAGADFGARGIGDFARLAAAKVELGRARRDRLLGPGRGQKAGAAGGGPDRRSRSDVWGEACRWQNERQSLRDQIDPAHCFAVVGGGGADGIACPPFVVDKDTHRNARAVLGVEFAIAEHVKGRRYDPGDSGIAGRTAGIGREP